MSSNETNVDAPAPDESTHNHEEDKAEDNKDTWNADNHGGMSRAELMEYSIKLDKEIRQISIDSVYSTIQNGTNLLFFGAVFCPHTQQFTAIWLNMQYKFDFYGLIDIPGLSIAKIQCADYQPKCFHYMRDEAFPTIVLFHEGHFIEELYDRDHVWEYIEQQSIIVKEGRFSEYTAKYTNTSLVTELREQALEEISHEKLEEESIGGATGIMQTVLPVSLFAVAVACVLLGVFLVRRFTLANRGKYAAVST